MANEGYPPGMHRPEWETVLVNTGQKTRPVGDPTVWGGSIATIIDADPVLGTTPRLVKGGQVVLAQAADRYSRSWSIQGVLWLPMSMWSATSPDVAPPGYVEQFPVTPTTPPLAVWLSVRMGIERMSQEHQILLSAGDLTQRYGLCSNQWSANGGPYAAQVPIPATGSGLQGVAFSCIGALIGNMISVQALYVRGPNFAAETCPDVLITAMVTPYAPGAGI